MAFTLINARPSPYGRKVAIALQEKGLEYEVVYDRPWNEGSCTPDYSPLEQLPILVSEEGEKIYDSPYILEWLETRFPQPPLLPEPVDARLEARKRQMLGERLLDFAGLVIFEAQRPLPSEPWIERQTRKIYGALAELERIYASGVRPGLEVDLGDIAVVTTLDLLEFVVADGISPDVEAFRWRGIHRALTALVEQLDQRASFASTMPQHMEFSLAETVA
jgi:glutathione S-transferase